MYFEASCNIGSARYPEHDYQINFGRNKYNEPCNENFRFYKDCIRNEGSQYILFEDFKEFYNPWVLISEHKKMILHRNQFQWNLNLE